MPSRCRQSWAARAIADGVSSSLFAGRSAQILARAAVENPPALERPDQLANWLLAVPGHSGPADSPAELAWHQRSKLQDGAYSTLLWLTLSRSDNPSVLFANVHAVGDSCLFLIREGQMLGAAPADAQQPVRARRRSPWAAWIADRKNPRCRSAALGNAAGDYLALATDAVAAWVFSRTEAGRPLDWAAWSAGSADQWQAGGGRAG